MESNADKRIIKVIKGMKEDPNLFIEKTTGKIPFYYQQEFARAIRDHRFVCGCWARQLGKSWIVRMMAIWFAFVYPKSFIMIVSSTEKQAYHFFDLLTQDLRESNILYKSVVDDLKGSCKFSNGSKIITCAPSEKAVRGYSVDFLIMDEADRIPREVIVGSLATTAARHGSVAMISTPNIGGIGSYFHQCFIDGMEARRNGNLIGERHGYVSFHYNWEVGLTVYRDEYIRGEKVRVTQLDEFFLKSQRNSLPEWEWKREYEAEWADEAGQYFNKVHIEASIWDKNYRMQEVVRSKGVKEYIGELYVPNVTYFAGIDVAKQIDYTVVCIVRVLEDGRFKIVYFLECQGRDYPEQEPYIIEALYKYHVRKAWMDRTGVGDSFVDYVTRTAYAICDELEKIEPIFLSSPKKIEVFGNITPIVGSALCQFPNHHRFLNEMKMLKVDITEKGNVQINAPKEMYDVHDDYPNAFALAMQCEQGGGYYGEPKIDSVAKYSEIVQAERERLEFFNEFFRDSSKVIGTSAYGNSDGFVASVGGTRNSSYSGRKRRSTDLF